MHGDEWLCVVAVVVLLVVVVGASGLVLFLKVSSAQGRADELAASVRVLSGRVAALESEQRSAPAAPVPAAPVAAPPPAEIAPAGVPSPPPLPPQPDELPPPPPRRTAAPAPEPTRPRMSLETFLGGRVLLVVGVVSVLVGLGFFLKLAIDRDWIGEEARIAIGAAAGLAALFGGDRLRRRGYDVYGQSLMGGGVGALYLCDWFASVRYEFWDRPAAFAIAFAITAAAASLAVRMKAAPLAWLGFAGAYLAPAMLGRNEDKLEGLTGWLVLIHAGVAAVIWLRAWAWIDCLAALGSVVYFSAWRASHFSAARLDAAAWCLAALVLAPMAVSLAPPVGARRRVHPSAFLALTIVLLFAYVLGIDLFFPADRRAFGCALLGLAAFVAGAAQLVRARVDASGPDVEALRGFALALVALAVPILLEGDAVAPAWAALGAACFHAGLARRSRIVTAAGAVSIALAAGDVLFQVLPLHAKPPFANGEFLAALSPCAALFAAGWSLARAREDCRALAAVMRSSAVTAATLVCMNEAWLAAARDLRGGEAMHAGTAAATFAAGTAALAAAAGVRALRSRGAGTHAAWGPLVLAALAGLASAFCLADSPLEPFPGPLFGASLLAVAALFFASFLGVARTATTTGAVVVLFALVTCQLHGWGRLEGEPRRAQVWMSVAWALYASALVGAGFLRKVAALRWAGIGVFLLTIGKVFLVDMSSLETAYRVGSFLGLGVLLVAASFLYQRLRKGADAPPPVS